VELPLEYFDEIERDPEDNSGDNDLFSVENITTIPEKKVLEEEITEELPSDTNDIPIQSSSVKTLNDDIPQELISKPQESEIIVNNIDSPLNGREVEEKTLVDTQIRPEFSSDELLQEISNIDSKIQALEEQIKSLDTEEKNNFNNFTQNAEDNYRNFEDEDGVDESNVVEVYTNKNSLQKQYIKRDINLLNAQKSKLLLKQQQQLDNTGFKGEPLIDNNKFVPNFSDEEVKNFLGEDNQALKNSQEVEGFLEGPNNTKTVYDDDLGAAVISESQGTLENAIEDHGGLNKAVNDSIVNQNNFSQISNPVTENVPDSNATVASNTQQILQLLTTISEQLKNFISASSNNKSQQSGNSNTKTSTAPTPSRSNISPAQSQSNASGKDKQAPIPNAKQDLPMAEDFPSDLDLSQLGGSNLLTRI
jgi:hypothetical protein